MMDLLQAWEQYGEETEFNISMIPKEIVKKGIKVEFEPKSLVVSRGEFPQHIYFIQSGTAVGLREYADGNEYNYFQIDQTNGNIGLLEVLARKREYIATIMSLTKVTAIKIDAVTVYDLVMSDISILRRCSVLLAEDLYKRSGNDGILYYFKGINRVRFYLVMYYETHKIDAESQGKVMVHAEYQDIAKQVGVSIRTVGRTIQQLKESKEITSLHKKITITKEQYKKMLDKIYI